jgi:hypothetical protein
LISWWYLKCKVSLLINWYVNLLWSGINIGVHGWEGVGQMLVSNWSGLSGEEGLGDKLVSWLRCFGNTDSTECNLDKFHFDINK